MRRRISRSLAGVVDPAPRAGPTRVSSASWATSTVGPRVVASRSKVNSRCAAEGVEHGGRPRRVRRRAARSSLRRTRRRVSSVSSSTVTSRRNTSRAAACAGVVELLVDLLGAPADGAGQPPVCPVPGEGEPVAARAARTARPACTASSGRRTGLVGRLLGHPLDTTPLVDDDADAGRRDGRTASASSADAIACTGTMRSRTASPKPGVARAAGRRSRRAG